MVVIVGIVFPESCFSILSIEDFMEATWAAREVMVLAIDLIPSRISGDAFALHVCDTTVCGCSEENEGMGWMFVLDCVCAFLDKSSKISLFWWRRAFSISAKCC